VLVFHVRPATQSTLTRVALQVGRPRNKQRCAMSQSEQRPGGKISGSGSHNTAEDDSSLHGYDTTQLLQE